MLPSLTLVILTPDHIVIDEKVDRVMLPALDGVLEVTPGRWPLVTELRADFVIWHRDGGSAVHAAIQGGVAVFSDNKLHVLSSKVVKDARPDELLVIKEQYQREQRRVFEPPIGRSLDDEEHELEETNQPMV